MELPNNGLQDLRQDLRRISLEQEIALSQLPYRPEIIGIDVDEGDPGAAVARLADIARGRVDGGGGADDHDEVDGAGIDEIVRLPERGARELLVEPDDARAEQAGVAFGAARELGEGDGGVVGVERGGVAGGRGGEPVVRGIVDGEAGVKGVVVVVLLGVVAAEAFDVE